MCIRRYKDKHILVGSLSHKLEGDSSLVIQKHCRCLKRSINVGTLLSGEVHQVACVLSFVPLLPHSPKTSRVYLCAVMKSRFGTEPWNSTSLRPVYVIGVSCYQNPVTTSECHGYLRLSVAGTAVQRLLLQLSQAMGTYCLSCG